MNPHYIIDGYNFIHKIPRFKQLLDQSLQQAREVTLQFLQSYLTKRNIKITVIFDGDSLATIHPPLPSSEKFKIIFSGPAEKADPRIQRFIRQQPNKKSLVLVSADLELVTFCKQQGAKTMAPESFYELINHQTQQEQLQQKYDDSLSPEQLDDWLKIFGAKKQ